MAKQVPAILYQCLKCRMFHYTLASSLECCHKAPKRMFAVGRVREGKVVVETDNDQKENIN